jgi:hypothetical protein
LRVPAIIFGRDPHDLFACGEEVSFQSAGEMPAVLDCPDALGTELGRPDNQGQVIAGSGVDGSLGEFPGAVVDGDDRMGALVRVDAKDQHGRVSSVVSVRVTSDWPVGIASFGR